MEYWNAGILGIKAEINHFNCKKLLQTHHSITPSFLPCETYFYFTGAIIPIGAKPLSSLSNSTLKFRSTFISVSNKGGQ